MARVYGVSTTSRPTPRLTQPPYQWVAVNISQEIKQPGSKTDQSYPFSAKVKNRWSYNSTPQYAFMACIGTTLLEDNNNYKTRIRFTFQNGIPAFEESFLYAFKRNVFTDCQAKYCPPMSSLRVFRYFKLALEYESIRLMKKCVYSHVGEL
jgi:hypothetical protein